MKKPFAAHSASDFVVVTPIQHRAKWAQQPTEYDERALEHEVLTERDKQLADELEIEQRLAARRGWELDNNEPDSNETLGLHQSIQRP